MAKILIDNWHLYPPSLSRPSILGALAIFLKCEKNVNSLLKCFAIFNQRFRWIQLKGYAQTVSITKNTKWMLYNRQFEIIYDRSFTDVFNGETGNDKVGMVKGEWYMENRKYPISFSHSPFDVFITSDLLPIEGQRSPFNASLMNFKLFKTGCFIRLYKSH